VYKNLTISDSSLWSARIYYFILGGAGGLLSPFINLFFNRQGLNGTEIGVVNGLAAVVAMVMAPIWTRSGSNSSRPRLMLQLTLLASAIVVAVLGFQSVFVWIAVLMVVRSLVSSGTSPMSDALVLGVTGRTKTGFGSVRLFTSAGWAILALIGGWLMGGFGLGVAFWGYAALTVVSVWVLSGVAEGHPASQIDEPASTAEKLSFKQVLNDLTHNRPMVGLAVMLAVLGFCMSGVNQFENIFVSQLGGSELTIGIVNTVGAVIEIPSMLLADWWVRRSNARQALMMGLIAYITLRLMVFVFPSVGIIILARALGGLTFSFYTVGLMRYIAENTNQREISTVLAIFSFRSRCRDW
jgi:MFS transporter, PPP family, 3-phenylpropionic acid transporter